MVSVCGRKILLDTAFHFPLVEFKNGAYDTVRQRPHEHTDTWDLMFTVRASV